MKNAVTTAGTKQAVLIFLALLPVLLLPSALAHAELGAALPEAEAVITEPLTEVELSFTEPVELRFSIFKVYKLDPEATQNLDLSAPGAWQRLNGLAGMLVSQVLTAKDEAGTSARADTGLATGKGQSRQVVIELTDDLSPGFYVVMWRALSVDTHSSQDFYVFGYQPGG